MPTAGAKPAHARYVLGWTSVSSPSYSAGSRKPLIRWIGKTQIDRGDRILPIERRNTKSPGPRDWLLTCFNAGSRYLEVGLWQEAKSNLVTIDCYFGLSGLESRLRVKAASSLSNTRLLIQLRCPFLQVALGKDDWIAWCWTLGPPV
ncbi:hypothetical protein YC2023_041077 [Brassica napus]